MKRTVSRLRRLDPEYVEDEPSRRCFGTKTPSSLAPSRTMSVVMLPMRQESLPFKVGAMTPERHPGHGRRLLPHLRLLNPEEHLRYLVPVPLASLIASRACRAREN